MLQEDKRQQLDGIVNQMIANKEPESNIMLVVNDFKSKYESSENPNATHGILDAFKKGAENVIANRDEMAQEVKDTLATPTTSPLGDFAKFAKVATGVATGLAKNVIAEPISTLFRAGGEVVENATGVNVNEATAQGVQKLIQAGFDTEAAKSIAEGYDKYVASNPASQLAGSALGDIAELLSYAIGAKGAKVASTAAVDTGKGIIDAGVGSVKSGAGSVSSLFKPVTKKIGMATGKTEVPLEGAVKSFKENFLSQLEGKSSSLKRLDKMRTNIIDTIAKNPDYHPIIDAENKTFNMTNQLKKMEADISSYSDDLGNLFEKVDSVSPGVNAKSIMDNISKNIFTKKNMAKFVVSGGEKSPFVNDVRKLLENMKQAYGKNVPRKDLWDIRKQIDNSINSISDTNVQKSLRQDLRRAFADSLETSLPNDSKSIVKRTMDEISKVIEARNYSRDVLQGFKIRGGKLTDIIRNSVTSEVGKAVGAGIGGVAGNVPGAIAGFAIGKKIGSWLAENTLTNASERKALLNLIKKKPAVFDDIKSYIENLPKEAKDNATKNIKKLPSPFNMIEK